MTAPLIDSYRFGTITIHGKRYHSDVAILNDEVKDRWWRRAGHELAVEDLREVLSAEPHVIVVGTGYSGMMQVPKIGEQYLENRGIELIVQKTEEACGIFNRLTASRQNVAAALHLTC